MKIDWQVDPRDVDRIQKFVNEYLDDGFVRNRISRNLADTKQKVGKEEFWKKMISARLTTRQKSSPDSPVPQFIRTEPFPLRYEVVKKQQSVEDFIVRTLTAHGGILDYNKIGNEMNSNFHELEQEGQWEETLNQVNKLLISDDKMLERQIAKYVDDLLTGFGPKQSRNLLQSLGLTRYEIPIDTRVIKFLNKFGFPFELNKPDLSNPVFYECVLDGIQVLCAASNIYPCVLDAAMFVSFDKDGWSEDKAID